MTCKICKSKTSELFEAEILHKYFVKYFYCDNCGFLSTEEPYWLAEAYTSVINASDTGIMHRNTFFSILTTNVIYYLFNHNKTFLDYAADFGIFVRLMRDNGFNFKWQGKYATNLLARGFEHNNEEEVELVTAFEVFEHFTNPLNELEEILKTSKNILFSTELLPKTIPDPKNWWYFGLNHGQHVSFYSKKTLQYLANKHGLNYYTNGSSLHLFTNKNINSTLFKLLIANKISYILYIWPRINLHSKIWEDHILLDNK